MGGFSIIFEALPDPRDANARHDLREILFIALAAMLCGANSCTEMAQFGRDREALLRTILTLKHGIPSHDTFSRVFRRLDPKSLEDAFMRFMAAFHQALGLGQSTSVLAVDGKSLRRAYEKGKAHMPAMMVSVWGATMRMTLAQTQVGAGGEAEAVINLLRRMSLKGCVVTADAIHCTCRTAATIKDQAGDYVLALKRNRHKLYKDVVKKLDAARRPRRAETHESGERRDERRWITMVAAPDLAETHRMKGLAYVARLISERTVNGKSERLERLFITSMRATPLELMTTIRSHWDIENGSHWQQDMVFHEDLARTRKDNGPRNLALMRRLTANVLKCIPDTVSTQVKRLRAAWNEDYFVRALTHMR